MKTASDAFGLYSTCSEAPFHHPEYRRIATSLGAGMNFHRKAWEWVFIAHHLEKRGVLQPGRRGLGFGVGGEPLPAYFAAKGVYVHATDAPTDLGLANGWAHGNQLAQGLSTIPRGGLTDEQFSRQMSFSFCDMNRIDPALRGFDFCWSSCALEHLGSLRAGLDFIINSLDTLKIGGVAVHTTEYNLQSNDATVDNAGTVIFRLRDMNLLIEELRALGHFVNDFLPAPDLGEVDKHVDLPPYKHDPHLKLQLEGYVATSCGVVVRKGR